MLFVSAIYGILFYFLLMFSIRSKTAISTRNPLGLEEALRYLKIHYLVFGILIIIFLVAYVAAIGVMIVESV